MDRTVFQPEGRLLHTAENQRRCAGPAALREAFMEGAVLEGRVLRCDAAHDLHVELGCMRGLIPRAEGAIGVAEGRVRDIALISRVNKPVSFVITGFTQTAEGEPLALLSRRRVQEACLRDYIAALSPGDVIPATVTHLEGFGAFCDVGAGVSALLPIDSISVSRIPHPGARFTPGQQILAVVREIDADRRITLTHKELLGTWEENAALMETGETVPGIVRSVESYGVFVELTPNLAGLAERAEGVRAGDHAAVYIKSMLPQKMKIKLILVDAFAAEYPPAPPHYFIRQGHIDRWCYSPSGCGRKIESVF